MILNNILKGFQFSKSCKVLNINKCVTRLLCDDTKLNKFGHTGSDVSSHLYNCIVVEQEGALRKITLNRPDKRNAFSFELFDECAQALREADEDPHTSMACVTGEGAFYSAGIDLIALMKEGMPVALPHINGFVEAFVEFRKPLVAAVNGPAVGIAVTTLPLCDLVIASTAATFHSPFTALGINPEACSSFTFPSLTGFAGPASQMILFNQKLSASEAFKAGLVTEVLPHDNFVAGVDSRLRDYAALPAASMRYSKTLMRDPIRDQLRKTIKLEGQMLLERAGSQEFADAVAAFASAKKKAKKTT